MSRKEESEQNATTMLERQTIRDSENAELRRRLAECQTDLAEARAQQTAAAEVLQVINSSPGDLAPVFRAIIDRAQVLCETSFGGLMLYDGERFQPVALQGVPARFKELLERGIRPQPGNPFGRVVEGAPFSQIHDLSEVAAQHPNDPLPRVAAELGGIRTFLIVPLRKDNALLGAITAYRREVHPFTDRQIALLQNFAAQAVIAIENARLLGELRQRTGDLQDSLDYQTATSDVLKVISRSVFDLDAVLQTVVTTAIRLCRADSATIYRNVDGEYRWAAGHMLVPEYEKLEREVRIKPGSGTVVGRAAMAGATVQIEDAWIDPLYDAKKDARVGGVHTMIGVPLLREGAPIGVIGLARRRVETFSEREIQLVATFADQAAIAIENARLLAEIRAARDTAEAALRGLKAAQANLIHAEKMASLGQLTAGIAHEIKNPLNFINNFAGLSVELLDELKGMAAPGFAVLDSDKRAEIDDTIEMLTGNLDKISEHGRRADGIVQSMLLHSRGGSGERQSADLNQLIDDALNLAYHGARAQDQNFNVILERDFADPLAPVELVPQDVTRVFLNLIGNGFHAVHQRRKNADDSAYRPILKVTTRELGDAVEVRVRDNGVGIATEHRDKLFQPFFTTKPAGEGTGLGLSISWDIVTQQHGGTISVDSAVGEFTEFTIRLPRRAVGSSGFTAKSTGPRS
jgi:two-component system, NtrC family, sensor kinase